jgi:hypothetical protein
VGPESAVVDVVRDAHVEWLAQDGRLTHDSSGAERPTGTNVECLPDSSCCEIMLAHVLMFAKISPMAMTMVTGGSARIPCPSRRKRQVVHCWLDNDVPCHCGINNP